MNNLSVLEMPLDDIMASFGMPSDLQSADDGMSPVDRINTSNQRIGVALDAFVEMLYIQDETDNFVMMKNSGHVKKGVKCVLSDRCRLLTRAEKNRLKERILFAKSKGLPSLLRYDKSCKMWMVNLRHYPTIEHARHWADKVKFPLLEMPS